MIPLVVLASLAAPSDGRLHGQDPEFQPLTLSEFQPRSKLKVNRTLLTRARFPVIDMHTHFGLRLKGDDEALEKYLDVMNRHQIALCTSLDAKLTDVDRHLAFLRPHRQRFLVFAHLDWQGSGAEDQPETWACNQVGFVRETCEQLRASVQKGVVGVKFFKSFGLTLKDAKGKLLRIDDRRFDPIWQTCGELSLPILIHTGDPAAFFDPIDHFNERYEELSRRPQWSFFGDQFPSRHELLTARNNVIRRHPNTKFIGAHMAGNPEDLVTVGQWLDEFPNLYVEFASRIGELGRQPYTSRKFFLKYQDRILFGTDGPWPELRLTYYWRFLETLDENFPYSEKIPPPQGLWNIYGIGLPPDVLKKVYYENAIRLIPTIENQYRTAAQRLERGQLSD